MKMILTSRSGRIPDSSNFSLTLWLLAVCLIFRLNPQAFSAASQGRAEHVVVVVWDGMRPDFVTPEHTPTLYRLAQSGTFFRNHHPVYVSSTEANGTALATGALPEHSGIFANKEYQPDIRRHKPVGTEDLEVVRRGDLLTHGHYLGMPTLAEIIQRAGFCTAVAGTKSVALLLDRSDERTWGAARASVNLFKGSVLPASAMAGLIAANAGQTFPAKVTFPNLAQDAWTTRALSCGMWNNDVPKLSLLWLSDPDYSQHEHGPGAPTAISAIESADRNLAKVLAALDEHGVRDRTDVFVVSDHGFSTVERGIDVTALLNKAGFNADNAFDHPQPGDILVVGLGGSVSLYVSGHDPETIRKLVRFFQDSDFAGVIFSRIHIGGTFLLKEVRLDVPNAPDLLVSLRWNSGTNKFGVPGLLVAESGKPGRGTHSSLSPFDMHNTLVAAGPDIRAAFDDELPTGNIDVGPTILWILGLSPPKPMDGRILQEALVEQEPPKAKPKQRTITASHRGKKSSWTQCLKVVNMGPTIYFDEGYGVSYIKGQPSPENPP
jgi:arylsulfatase A-like enzyme